MRCPNCNKGTGKSGSYCTHCGSVLPAPRPRREEEERGPTEPVGGNGGLKAFEEDGPSMIEKFKSRAEGAEDLAHGQVVVIAARWILVVAGLGLALISPEAFTNPDAVGELRVQIMLIMGLAVANFFLHAQVLMKRPVNAAVAYGSSVVDIAVISLIIIAGNGYDSGAFVFYFPAVLAMSVAFRTEVAFSLAAGAIAVYGAIASPTLLNGEDGATFTTRLLMLAAIAVCGNVYWRVERDRRDQAAKTSGVLQPVDVEAVRTHSRPA